MDNYAINSWPIKGPLYLKLEKKEKLKQRIKQSPDGADAAALTFATDSMQDYKVQSYISSSNNDFNPFDW